MNINSSGDVVQGLAAIQQCILIILTTYKGSDPTRPEFGCGVYDWIDSPVNVAIPNMKKNIAEAIGTYEKRVKIIRILHTIDVSTVVFTIEMKLADSVIQTIISYGLGS